MCGRKLGIDIGDNYDKPEMCGRKLGIDIGDMISQKCVVESWESENPGNKLWKSRWKLFIKS